MNRSSGVRQLATNSRGGLWHESELICGSTIFPMLLCCICLSTTHRPDRSAPEVRGRTRATPHFLPLYRQTGRWGVTGGVTPPAPPLGSLPSKLSLREGSEPGPQAGADAPQASSMKPRYPILIIGGLGCSAWGFLCRPFPLPGDDPMLDLVLYHNPNFYTWIVWWYYAAPYAAVLVGGLFLITIWRVWFECQGRKNIRPAGRREIRPLLDGGRV